MYFEMVLLLYFSVSSVINVLRSFVLPQGAALMYGLFYQIAASLPAESSLPFILRLTFLVAFYYNPPFVYVNTLYVCILTK